MSQVFTSAPKVTDTGVMFKHNDAAQMLVAARAKASPHPGHDRIPHMSYVSCYCLKHRPWLRSASRLRAPHMNA